MFQNQTSEQLLLVDFACRHFSTVNTGFMDRLGMCPSGRIRCRAIKLFRIHEGTKSTEAHQFMPFYRAKGMSEPYVTDNYGSTTDGRQSVSYLT